MQPHSLGKHPAFHISSFTNQIFDGIAMITVDHILRNNWPFIQIVSHIMSRSTDQLYTTFKRLLIWTCPDEGGQKAMVDINNLMAVGLDNKRLQYLHIASKYQEIYLPA